MQNDQRQPDEPASDRLAAFMRDMLLVVIYLAMVGLLLYMGGKAIVTRHVDADRSVKSSLRWFHKPLNGPPAMLAGLSFLSLAAAFLAIGAHHPRIVSRVPSWVLVSHWWFLAGWALIYFPLRFLTGS